MAKNQFANKNEKEKLKNEYFEKTKRLSYPLFDEKYLSF